MAPSFLGLFGWAGTARHDVLGWLLIFGHRHPVRVRGGIDPAQADAKPLNAGSTELVDRTSEPIGDLPFLGHANLP